MKYSIITRMISFFLLSCVLLLSLFGCQQDEPTLPPEESEENEETGETEKVRLFDFQGEPYHIRYESNGSLSSCYVSDIIINPDYTEDFTIVIPATTPLGIVTKIDIGGFDHLSALDNVPCAMTRADFDTLLAHLSNKEADAQRVKSYYECYDLIDAKSEKMKNVMLTEHPLVAYCTDGYYALRSIGSDDLAWLSDCLKNVDFNEKDCSAAEYNVVRAYVEHKNFSPQHYQSILREFYYRGSDHVAGIVLPETVSEIVGNPFADCAVVIDTTTQGKPDNFTTNYEDHLQLVEENQKKDGSIPFERISTAGDLTFQWFYTPSMTSMSFYYGLALHNGANVELIVNDSYRIYAEKTHIDLPEGQTDMRTLDIRWYNAVGSMSYNAYPVWYSNPEIAIVFDSEDMSGWINGLEYHYEYVDGEFQLEFIVFPVGEYQFVWIVNVDTLPYSDGSFVARLLDISTARAARDEFASLILSETK